MKFTPSPVVIAGIGTPIAVLVVSAAIALIFGSAWGFAALAAGLCAIIGVFLFQLDRLARWADSAFDTPVPEAKGAWGAAFSALYRRTRAREARQRDLATTIDRFRNAVEALPDGMVILDAA